MVRRIFQDVVPPKRSIRDISLDEARALERKAIADFRRAHSVRISGPRKKSSHILPIFVLIIATVCGTLYFLSAPKVTITYTPKQISVPLAFDFISATSTKFGLVYTPILLSKEVTQTIVTQNTALIERRAGGTIVVYNAYTAENQRLIKNTRFEAPNGKIFRIKDSVIIPGYKMIAGNKVPGSAEAQIQAEAAGDEYNVGKVDFSIPGFAGTPRATLVYARAKSDILGGFIGTAPSPTEQELSGAKTKLDATLKQSLLQDVEEQYPGFLLLPGAYTIETNLLPLSFEKEKVEAHVSGILHGIAFKESDLAQAIAQKALVDFDGAALTIKNPLAIGFSSTAKIGQNPKELPFHLSGNVLLEWNVDVDALRDALVGGARSLFIPTIAKDTGIQKAEVVISPFLDSKFSK